MRYLRMFSNSAFAGLLAAVYLTVLVLYLNPTVRLAPDDVVPILMVMAVTYGAHIAVVSYVLYVIRQIAVAEPSSPGWISLRLLTWSAAALAGTLAVMMWLHASGLRNTIDARAIPRMTQAVIAFSAAAGVFLLLAVVQGVARAGGRAAVAVLFTLATIGSIVTPFAARGPAMKAVSRPRADVPTRLQGQPGGARVLLLCLDGASLDVISPAVAAGRLPNFSRVLERGASMHLATTRPAQPEPAWVSVVTGKWPARHGIRGAARYRAYTGGAALELLPDYLYSHGLVRFGFFTEEPHTSASLQAQPVWRIVAAQGLRAGLVGMPLTYPAEPLSGFVVSDQFQRRTRRAAELEPQPTVYPPELEEVARAALFEDDEQEGTPVRRSGVEAAWLPPEAADRLAADRLHRRLAGRAAVVEDVRLLAIRYIGIDVIGHYYQRFAQPDTFAQVTEDERRALGRVLDEYYEYVDSLVGDALAMLRADDLLVVVSAFGMEPLPLGKRMLERLAGDPRFGASHERAPDGFAMAFGTDVAPGRLTRGSVVDVVPTLLYFLGFPVGRDMDGFARTDMFSSAFNSPRTITFIPSYELP